LVRVGDTLVPHPCEEIVNVPGVTLANVIVTDATDTGRHPQMER
jgi:hypothetical protein